jgi:hypothetical protein
MVWARDFEQILYTFYTHPLGADLVTGESWQLVTAFHDEGAGLILCKRHTQDHDQTHSYHVGFGFASTNTTIVMSSTVIVGASLNYEADATITKLVTQLGKIPLHVQEVSPL